MRPICFYYSSATPGCRYCDTACNTTTCDFDGGDCLGENPRMGFENVDESGGGGSGANFGGWEDDDCSPACLDNWLGDR